MGRTHGIHWIATTHGTWLHGDPRGSWRNGKLIGPDPFLEEVIRDRMHANAVVLSKAEVAIVANALGEALSTKPWPVLAATIQPTHTHVVFAPFITPVDDVIATLKYRSACAVFEARRAKGQPTPASLWTEGKFPVFIYDEQHLQNAIAYVRRHNTRIGLPADPYAWIARPPAPKAPTPKGPAI
jgi:hypothetical protein